MSKLTQGVTVKVSTNALVVSGSEFAERFFECQEPGTVGVPSCTQRSVLEVIVIALLLDVNS